MDAYTVVDGQLYRHKLLPLGFPDGSFDVLDGKGYGIEVLSNGYRRLSAYGVAAGTSVGDRGGLNLEGFEEDRGADVALDTHIEGSRAHSERLQASLGHKEGL